MRARIGAIMGVWLLFWGAQAFGTTIAFYEDGVIEDGDVYTAVGVYNNATVDMTGGSVTFQLTAYDFSIVNISGGSLEAIICTGSGTVNLSGGSVISGMGVSSSGTANVFGGTLAVLDVGSSNPSNLHGGTISDYLRATSTTNVYGYGFDYNPLAGSYGGGQLTGFWLNNSPFSLDLYASDEPGGAPVDTYSHLMLIPEPATILFLGAGMLLVTRKK